MTLTAKYYTSMATRHPYDVAISDAQVKDGKLSIGAETFGENTVATAWATVCYVNSIALRIKSALPPQ